MKTKLGLIGTLIGTAGLLALPAMAQQRGTYRNGNTQGATQQYSAPANTQSYSRQNSTNSQSNVQDYSRSYTPAPAYRSDSNYGRESYGNSWRGEDNHGRREHERHERWERSRRWSEWR